MLTIRNPKTRFNIAGDRAHFNKIVQDMIHYGGELAPSDHWRLNIGNSQSPLEGYCDELFEQQFNALEKMMDPWVGVKGMRALSEEAVREYEPFLRPIDHMRLLPDDILSHGISNGWRGTDLGSVLDFNLITGFMQQPPRERLFICEVGGGYGRLAEVFLEVYGKQVRYVLVDAVPGSLMYAYFYLKAQFPEMDIRSYYAGYEYDENCHCY